MKQLSKKKRLVVIIAAAAVITAAIVVAIVFAAKGNNASQENRQDSEYITVAGENANDSAISGSNDSSVSSSGTGNEGSSTTASNNGVNNTTASNGKNKIESTTESTTQFTTIARDKATYLPEEPFDDRMLTESMALYSLQTYYGEKYVVNYDVPNYEGDDTIAFAVFKNDDKKTNIEYRVTVNMYTGKTVQTDKKGKTTDISDKINY